MRKRSTIVALALSAVSALVIASAAGGAIRTVTFDDLAANTRVSNEYQSSHGVTFVSDPGIRPVVKPFPGKAHSGDRVGVYKCEGLDGCGESFFDPQLRATLTTPRPTGFRHAVYFRLSDGRRLVRVVGANRRRLVLKGVSRRVSARIKVQGLGHANGKGPAARVSVKRRSTRRPR